MISLIDRLSAAFSEWISLWLLASDAYFGIPDRPLRSMIFSAPSDFFLFCDYESIESAGINSPETNLMKIGDTIDSHGQEVRRTPVPQLRRSVGFRTSGVTVLFELQLYKKNNPGGSAVRQANLLWLDTSAA
jgi:hypothetical protein